MMGCRYDLQRLEVKGALSDRAVASALSLADLPWLPNLPEMPTAHRPQPSERLFKLLQATGARQKLFILSRFPANNARYTGLRVIIAAGHKLEKITCVLSSPHVATVHSLPRAGGATGAELPPGTALRVRLQDPRLARPIRVLGSADGSAGMASQTVRPVLSDYSKAFAPPPPVTQMPAALKSTGTCPMHETETACM